MHIVLTLGSGEYVSTHNINRSIRERYTYQPAETLRCSLGVDYSETQHLIGDRTDAHRGENAAGQYDKILNYLEGYSQTYSRLVSYN